MKKILKYLILVVLLIIGVVSLTGCGNKKNSQIVGSWKTDGTNIIYTFNEDNTGSISGNGINTMEFTYKIKANKISISYTKGSGTFEQEYSIQDNKLYIGDSIICTKIK